tara:strand:- start:487 stop:1284 length:798 start_codon:yes stop_codon:yes gene_type:complete
MTKFATGKYALSISDRSGLAFPYLEMVKEWNGAWVHFSEYEPKQPQLQPKPVSADPQALKHARPQRTAFFTPSVLNDNPFSTTGSSTTVTVTEDRHGRSTGDAVRFYEVKEIVGGVGISTFELNTTLNGNITDSATTITLANASSFPTSGYIVIVSTDATTGLYTSETIKYTGKSSNDLTGCTRGTSAPSYGTTPESTTAVAHTSGAKVYGSYIITKVTETINYPGQPSTETVSNKFTITLASNASSTAVGGGYFVFGGPVNDRP